jgi:hypothetical protein
VDCEIQGRSLPVARASFIRVELADAFSNGQVKFQGLFEADAYIQNLRIRLERSKIWASLADVATAERKLLK